MPADCQTTLPKRAWVYVQRPAQYGIAPCDCGNEDPDWSEFEGRLWCAACEKDFVPTHNGIFDGPIPLHTSQMLGLRFDRFNLETQQVEPFQMQDAHDAD